MPFWISVLSVFRPIDANCIFSEEAPMLPLKVR